MEVFSVKALPLTSNKRQCSSCLPWSLFLRFRGNTLKPAYLLPFAAVALLCMQTVHADIAMSVELQPTPDPQIIASSGGIVKYNRLVQNLGGTPLTLNYRGLLLRPDGSEMPMTSDLSLNLPSYGSDNRTGLGFSIPQYFPAGQYRYQLFYRESNKPGYNRYGFEFSKSGTNPAPTPRLDLQITGDTVELSESGGTVTVTAQLFNTSPYKESVRTWSVLTLPNGDKRVPNEIKQQSLNANANVTLANAVINVAATDPIGQYQLAYYALSNGRNTPALTKTVTWTKNGQPISQLQWPDYALLQCLNETATAMNWRYVEEVVSLDCTDRGIRQIDGIQDLSALQTLILAGNDLTFVGTPQLPTTLQSLNLANNRLRDFSVVSSLPTLIELDLSGNRLTQVFGIEQFNQLESLNLAGNDLDNAEQLRPIVEGMPTLKKLNLADIYLGDSDVLSWLNAAWQLEELDLSRTQLPEPYFPFLPELHTLRLAGNVNVDLTRLTSLPQLRAIDLSDTAIRDISPLQSLTQLEELRLSNNPAIDGNQVQTLIHNNPGLTRLALADIVLPFDVVAALMASGSHAILEELDLDNTDQNPSVLPFPNLRALNLSNNPIQLVPPLPHPEKLTSLRLANTLITHLHLGWPLDSLAVLDLSNNALLDSYQVLQTISPLSALRELYLADFSSSVQLSSDPKLAQVLAQLSVLDLQRASVNLSGLSMMKLKKLDLADASVNEPDPIIHGAHSLRDLNLSNVSLRINHLPVANLDRLIIGGQHWLQAHDLDYLIYSNPDLRALSLRDIKLSNDTVNRLHALAPRLQWLDLSNTGLDENALYPLTNFQKLRYLDVSGIKAPYSLPWLPRLHTAVFSNMGLTHQSIVVGGRTPNRQLRYLDLSGNPELGTGEIQSMIFEHHVLSTLILDDLNLSTINLEGIPARETIQHLSLKRSAYRWTYGDWPSLRNLDLTETAVDSPWFPAHLERLNLNRTQADFGGWLPLPPRLRALHLAEQDVEPGLIFDVVNRYQLLRVLDISSVNMQGMSFDSLRDSTPTRLRQLHTLNIGNTGLVFVNDLSDMVGLRKVGLQNLNLAQTPILPPTLNDIDLANNQLSFLPIYELSFLRHLNVSNNPALATEYLQPVLWEARSLQTLSIAQMPQLDFTMLFNNGSSGYLLQLQTLNVADNQLTSVEPFANLPALRSLDASKNLLTNLEPVRFSMHSLQTLDIRENASLPCHVVDEISWTRPELTILRPEQCPAMH